MRAVVGGVHLRLTEFFVQVAFRELHCVHRFQRKLKIIFNDGLRREIDDLLRQFHGTVVVLSYFSDYVGHLTNIHDSRMKVANGKVLRKVCYKVPRQGSAKGASQEACG
jgi:hypothetical protein